MKPNAWDHALKVTATGEGLVGHAGAILLRKAADVTGLTSLLSGALEEKGKSPLLDQGTVLVLTAAAIALGATSLSAANALNIVQHRRNRPWVPVRRHHQSGGGRARERD